MFARFGPFLLAALLCAVSPHHVVAQIYQPEDVGVSVLNPTLEGTYRAVLRTPPDNPKAHIGIFVMHAFGTNGAYRQTGNDLTGIDYESSNTSTVANIRTITKPLLLVANSAHYFIVTNEIVFDNAASADKTFAITEGAVHGGAPCTACEQALGLPPGSFGDTLAHAFDFIDAWLAQRF